MQLDCEQISNQLDHEKADTKRKEHEQIGDEKTNQKMSDNKITIIVSWMTRR